MYTIGWYRFRGQILDESPPGWSDQRKNGPTFPHPCPQIFDHSGPKFRHNGNVSPLKNDVFYHQKCLFRSAVWLSVSPSHLSTIWTKTARQISHPTSHSGSHISLSKSALENWNILTLTRTAKLYPVVHCVLPSKGAPNPALKHFLNLQSCFFLGSKKREYKS